MPDTKKVTVCAEIEYDGVHSDICMVHNGTYAVTPDYRTFLHQCLDEWLDRSRGTGIFWIGDPDARAADLT